MKITNKLVKITDKLVKVTNGALKTILRLENALKGYESPCGLCVGCEDEDVRKGTCSGFILRERL